MTETVYPYTDAEGRTLYEVVRLPKPGGGKTFKQRRPGPDGGWITNLDGVERVPYRLPDIAAAAQHGETLWVVEGEKDADRLADLDLYATTNAGGAGWAWPTDWTRHFAGVREVVVVADNDDPGRAAATARAQLLTSVVPDVRIIDELPGVGPKGDVSDFLDAGHTLLELLDIAETAPWVTAPAPDPAPASEPRRLTLRWVHEAIPNPPPEPPVLIDGMLRAGELAVLVAPRKLGKSWVSMQAAILLARGKGKLFGQLPIQKRCRVLLAQGELDEWGSWDRWRYLTHKQGGAPEGIAESFDMWRIRVEKRVLRQHDHESGDSWTTETREARIDPGLEEAIVEHGIDVLIIDPWAVFYGGAENSNDEAEAALGRLRDISRRTGVAILIVHHISKVTEVREPEDMWRGAGRLADWASTGITMLPHYKREQDWERAGFTRQTARRWADLHFMRRGAPTEDFSIRWDATNGWWEKGDPPAGEGGPPNRSRWTSDPEAVAELLRLQGGTWASTLVAADAMGLSQATARQALKRAVDQGLVERFTGEKNAKGWRLPEPQLRLVRDMPDVDDPDDDRAPDWVYDEQPPEEF